MFPEAACKSMQSILGDAAHSMEEVLEVKGHAGFPGLDVVWISYGEHHKHISWSPECIEIFRPPLVFVRLHS